VYPKQSWTALNGAKTSGNEIQEHGVDFRLAALIFKNPIIEAEDE
jgi:hypothetical protein